MTAPGTTFDTALTRGAAVTLVVAGGWAVTTIGAVAIEAVTDGRLRPADHTGCPTALRLWLLGLFVALLAGTSPAQASGPGSGASGPSGHGADTVLDGLPLPDRVAGSPGARRTPGRSGVVVVVGPGDSLWRIARDRLPPGAEDAAVAATVAVLYAANRSTIGPDPDRLSPGQHLDFPDPATLPEAP